MPARTKVAPKVESPDWGSILDSLQSEGGAGFIFPKGSRTRVRLLQGEGQPAFVTVESTFTQGERTTVKTKYLLPAIQPDADGDDADKVKGLIVPKTVFRAIAELANEGWDLWSPDGGYGITIARSGTGLETKYSVMPSKNAVEVDSSLLESIDIAKMAEDYNAFQNRSRTKAAKETEAEDETDY